MAYKFQLGQSQLSGTVVQEGAVKVHNESGTEVSALTQAGIISGSAAGKFSTLSIDSVEVFTAAQELSNVASLDATTEATVEAAIDTLANLVSAGATGVDLDVLGPLDLAEGLKQNGSEILSDAGALGGLTTISGSGAIAGPNLVLGGGTWTEAGVLSPDGAISAGGSVTAVGSFVIGSADMNEADLEKLDGITNGTAAASKAVVLDASKNIGTIGELSASVLSGSEVHVALENLHINGTAVTSTAGELNILDGVTATAAELNYSDIASLGTGAVSKALVFDASGQFDGATNGLILSASVFSGSGAGITDISSDTVDTTTNGDDATFYVPFIDQATGEDGAVLNIQSTLALNPSTGVVTIAGSAPSLVIGSAAMVEADLEKLDGITNGTAAASKAVVLDASKNIGTIGQLSASILSGTAVHVDLEELHINGTAVTSTAGELNILDGVTATAAELNYVDIASLGTGAASKALVFDASGNFDGASANLMLTASAVSSSQLELALNALSINGTAVSSTAAELNYVDITTAGTVEASKAVITDGNKDVTGFRNVTATAAITAGSSFVIGSADLNEADMEKIDGITNGAGAASKALVLDASSRIVSGVSQITASYFSGDGSGLTNITLANTDAAGSDTQVQFNQNGEFAASAGMTYNGTGSLTLSASNDDGILETVVNFGAASTYIGAEEDDGGVIYAIKSSVYGIDISGSADGGVVLYAGTGADAPVAVQGQGGFEVLDASGDNKVAAISVAGAISGSSIIEGSSLKVDSVTVITAAQQLQNIASLDATTEATVEAAIDTLANLVSAGASGADLDILGPLDLAEGLKQNGSEILSDAGALGGLTTISGSGALSAASLVLDSVAVSSTAAELNYVDIASLGTGATSKAVVFDADGQFDGASAGLILSSSAISGTVVNVPFSGLEINGVAVSSTAGELNILDGVTATAAELNYNDIASLGTGAASKALVFDASGNFDGASANLMLTASAVSSSQLELALNALSINGTAVTSDASELNILDGVTATAAELNYNDIASLGTGAASKALVFDASGQFDGTTNGLILSASYFKGDGSALTNVPGGVAGSNTYVQFNQTGDQAGDIGFQYNGTGSFVVGAGKSDGSNNTTIVSRFTASADAGTGVFGGFYLGKGVLNSGESSYIVRTNFGGGIESVWKEEEGALTLSGSTGMNIKGPVLINASSMNIRPQDGDNVNISASAGNAGLDVQSKMDGGASITAVGNILGGHEGGGVYAAALQSNGNVTGSGDFKSGGSLYSFDLDTANQFLLAGSGGVLTSSADLTMGSGGTGLQLSTFLTSSGMVKLTGLGTATVALANDLMLINDAATGDIRNTSLADYSTAIINNSTSGLSASSGVLGLSLFKLGDGTLDVANDKFAFLDATDNVTYQKTFVALASAMAGGGITATNGVLSTDIAAVAAVADGGTLAEGYNYFADLASNAGVTLPAAPTVGDVVHVKAGDLGDGIKITINRAGAQVVDDDQTAIYIESPYGAVSLVYVVSNEWRIV